VRQRGGIAVVIAHLPGVLATVDTVLAMGNGCIRAFGPKDEVLSKVLRPIVAAPSPLKVINNA
jgi:ABC-type protease/lipase transport system fused ATPase/permease subunit